jgi:hypothetical protein
MASDPEGYVGTARDASNFSIDWAILNTAEKRKKLQGSEITNPRNGHGNWKVTTRK